MFFVVTGVGRAAAVKLVGDPQSRYQYVAVVLLAPAIAVAVDGLFRRWRPVGVVAVVVLLVGVPGNIVDASHFGRREAQITKQSRAALLSIGRLPLASRAPADLQPDPFVAPLVTIGWLRAGVASGRVPAPAHAPDAALLASNRLRLSLMQVETPRGPACAALTGPVDRRIERGDRLRIGNGAVRVQLLDGSVPLGIPLTFGNALLGRGPTDHELVAVAGPLRVAHRAGPGQARLPLLTTARLADAAQFTQCAQILVAAGRFLGLDQIVERRDHDLEVADRSRARPCGSTRRSRRSRRSRAARPAGRRRS